MIEVYTIGGFKEVGKNMTAIRYKHEIVILDMGLNLPNYIKLTEEEREDVTRYNTQELRGAEAVPDDSFLMLMKDEVKAIIPSHAHLDHVGAIPYLAKNYNCPIICTPFTGEVIRSICKEEKINLPNPIEILNSNSKRKISDNITIEFIHITHSTPQAVMILIKTPEGSILYSNDFKFDNFPTIGSKPNYKRLEELKDENVKLLICDSLYCNDPKKMPGENVVEDMLKDILLSGHNESKAIVVTTFSSHLGRLKSILAMGKKMGRKVVFIGRSLSKYIQAGENIGLINFSKDADIVKFRREARKKLKQIIRSGVSKYLLVVTGHQGEPKAILTRIVEKELPFVLDRDDYVIFSCITIPTEPNIEQRDILEKKLKKYGIRMFKDVHVSGHAAREDIRDLIQMVKPKKIIPAHSEKRTAETFLDLAKEVGYSKDDILVVGNGRKIVLE